MKRQRGIKFWQAYFEILLQKFIPRSMISINRQVQFVIFLCLFLVVIVFLISLISGWYFSQDIIDGLWVEIHGVLIEVFIFAFLFDWIIKKREQIKYHAAKSIVYSKLYSITNRCLYTFVSKYSSEGKKQYVYFTSIFEISRKLDTPDSFEPSIDLLDEIKFDDDGGIFLVERYIERLKETHEKLSSILEKYIFLIEPSILVNIQKVIDEIERCNKELSPFIIKDDNVTTIKNLLGYNNSIVYYLYKLTEKLEEKAERIETREEHQKAMVKERDEAKKILKNLNSELDD